MSEAEYGKLESKKSTPGDAGNIAEGLTGHLSYPGARLMPQSTSSSENTLSPDESQLSALEVVALACGYQMFIDLRTKPATLSAHNPDFRSDFLNSQFAIHVDEIMAAVRRALPILLQSRQVELTTMPYADYLQTPEWHERRLAALERAEHRCQLCNADSGLHVHHRTYFRRGQEQPADLIVLCADCHKLFHDHGRLR